VWRLEAFFNKPRDAAARHLSLNGFKNICNNAGLCTGSSDDARFLDPAHKAPDVGKRDALLQDFYTPTHQRPVACPRDSF